MRLSTPKRESSQANLFALPPALEDDRGWAERAAHWLQYKPPRGRGRPRHDKLRQPLILSGHGVRLRVEHGALVVHNGFTHYPQTRETMRLFPGSRGLPSRVVILDADGTLSFDVLTWLSARGIPLIQVEWQGQVVTAGVQSATDLALYRAQLKAQSGRGGLALATQLVRDKVINSAKTLHVLPPSGVRERTLMRLAQSVNKLDRKLPTSVEELRLIEGRAALAYFRCWQSIPMRWKGTGRRPIPPEWHHIGLRQSLISGTNRHATHPFHAVLNYAYTMLESQVRIETVATGLDPTIGYLHATRSGRVALVYDLMEPLRSEVDAMILRFVGSHIFSPNDFVVTPSGACRLHPQLARAVGSMSVKNDAVREVVQGAAGLLKEVL